MKACTYIYFDIITDIIQRAFKDVTSPNDVDTLERNLRGLSRDEKFLYRQHLQLFQGILEEILEDEKDKNFRRNKSTNQLIFRGYREGSIEESNGVQLKSVTKDNSI